MTLSAHIVSTPRTNAVPVEVPVVASLAGLRLLAGNAATIPSAVVRGHGGGTFAWTTTLRADDGVTRYNAGGVGASVAGWERIYSGPLDARWAGAVGDGVAEEDTALNLLVQAAIGLAGTSASLSTMPDLLIPAGTYSLPNPIDLAGYSGRIHAEGAILRGTDNTKDLLANVSASLTIRGLSLAGGRDAVAIATANADTVVIILEKCSFRRVGRRHISADGNSNSSILNVYDCRFLSDSYSVKSATNASPIVIETYVDHEFNTGDSVNVVDVEGNTAANDTWTVTKIDATHFSLNGSVGNGVAVLPGAGNNGCGKAADLFVLNSLDHVNFIDCWISSPRNVTWNNTSSRLRIRGGIFVPGSAPTSAVWIQNDNGSVWAQHNMFSGERPRKILTSSAAASFGAATSICIRDNICSAPSSESPFTFTAIPNEISIRNNAGLQGITVTTGGGNEVSGYSALGAQAFIDIDSQYLRLFSADSDNLTRDAFIARMLQPKPSSRLSIARCLRSLEGSEIGESDYGPLVSGSCFIDTIPNDAGLNTLKAEATAEGQNFVKQYTAALTGLADGPYTVVIPVTVVGPAVEVLLEIADGLERYHLSEGAHVLAFPFVWKSGTTANTFAIELRAMPDGAYVLMEPFEIYAGHVQAHAQVFDVEPPSGTSGHRWLKGRVIWNSNPYANGPLAWICAASSTRTGTKTFDAGTWTAVGHTLVPGGTAAVAAQWRGDGFDQGFFEGGTNVFLNAIDAAAAGTRVAGLATQGQQRFSAGDSNLFSFVSGFVIDQGVSSPTWAHSPRNSNTNPTDWTLKAQSAFAGSADTGGYLNFEGGTKDGAGAQGGVRLRDGGGSNRVVVDANGVGFNGQTPALPNITGALSTVTDAAAKAVLTSIIAALKNAAGGTGLVTDGTT